MTAYGPADDLIPYEGDWDYIIIGSGSSGCVLANRLSADETTRVLLIEAGGGDSHLSLRVPAGLVSAVFDERFNWNYPSQPDKSCNNAERTWSAGKALGGSSSINAMLFTRGAQEDFDGWAQKGCTGWDYTSVLPYFRDIEDFQGSISLWRGRDGEMKITYPSIEPNILKRVMEAAETAGYDRNEDYNAGSQLGAALAQANIWKGRRHSAARAFLKPAIKRANLKVLTGAQVTRIGIEDGAARTVEFAHSASRYSAKCRREIILSAGAIGTPKILMLSGIGDPQTLQKHGIPLVHQNKSVGKNLMEHPGVYVGARTSEKTLNYAARPHVAPLVFLKWLLLGTGAASNGAAIAQIMAHSEQNSGAPDIQMLLSLVGFTPKPDGSGVALAKHNGLAFACCVMKPEARGEVMLASSDPLDPPTINHELLSSDADITRLIEAGKRALDLYQTPPLERVITQVDFPVARHAPDSDWIDYLKDAVIRGDHPCGTCRMGADGSAVVDPRLRVKGIERLRVADASVMPVIPNANTNASALMIGAYASAIILSDARAAR